METPVGSPNQVPLMPQGVEAGIDAQVPSFEQPGLFVRAAAKVGAFATRAYARAYEGVVTTVGMMQAGVNPAESGQKLTGNVLRYGKIAAVAGVVAVGTWASVKHGIDFGGHDTAAVTTDQSGSQINFDLAADTKPLAEGGTPSPSYDPLFDRNGGGTERQGLAGWTALGLAAGGVASVVSTVAVTRRAMAARRRANQERRDYGHYHGRRGSRHLVPGAAQVQWQRAVDANAALNDRMGNRATGAPRVTENRGGVAVPMGYGTPGSARRERPVFVNGIAPERYISLTYQPTEAIPTQPRPRGFWRSLFGRRRVEPRI